MSTTKERIILLLLHDGTKIEGVLIKIDKENLKMILERGKVIKENTEEPFEKLEVSKKDIKEIRVLEEKEVVKKETKKEEAKQEEVKKESTTDSKTTENAFSSIPLNLQQKYQTSEGKYDKGGFFDALTISNNKDNFKEARTYNEKNKETFGLDENYRGNHSRKRGGYRGRGGYSHGGYHHNKHYNRGGGGYNSHNQNYRGGYSGGPSYKNEGGNEYN